MNVKLTESDYQHMIIELITQSIDRIEDLRQSSNEDMVDWVYFIERLKIKGAMGDLQLLKGTTTPRALIAARTLRKQFADDDVEKNITTMI